LQPSMESFLTLVPRELRDRSGAVFYSGRSAFSRASSVYLLGLNPGGDPGELMHRTIAVSIEEGLSRASADWSAYVDESWQGKTPGTSGLQPRVLHLLRNLGLQPRSVPSSNVVFVRSKRELGLGSEARRLVSACWPVHQAVIEKLEVKAVICFGGTAGKHVRNELGAHSLVGTFTERNLRRWTSTAHAAGNGRLVFTLTHPSIADWTSPSTDPSAFVKSILLQVPDRNR